MKNLVFLLMFLIHGCFCPGVFAQTTPNTQTVFDYLQSPVNLVKNPHARLNTIGVTVSSSPLAVKGRATGSGEIRKLASHTCNTTALNGYCDIALNNPNPEDVGKRCRYGIVYTGDASLNSLALDGVGVQPMKNQASGFTEAYVDQPCTATSPTLRILQTTAGTGQTIKYGAYVLPNVAQTVSQATFYGGAEHPGAASCGYLQNTSTSEANYVDLGTAPSCATTWSSYGNCAAVGPTSHQITCTNMPPGDYKFEISTELYSSTSANECNFKFSDGTNQFGFGTVFGSTSANTSGSLLGRQTYTTAGTRTFKVVSSDNGASTTCGISAASVGRPLIWRVWRFPTSSETVATVDNLDSTRIDYTPTITGLGTGSATVVANYYTNGSQLTTCAYVTKDASAGSGGAFVSLSMPPGFTVTSPSTESVPGTGYTNMTSRQPIVLGYYQGALYFFETGAGRLAGSTVTANAFFGGCVTVNTTRVSTNGVVKIDPPVYGVDRLTSGTTYNVPAGTKWLRVRMAGGGGGGGGGNTTVAVTGTGGTSTTFGPHTASGGGPGGLNGGSVGTCTVGAGGRSATTYVGNAGTPSVVSGAGSGGTGGAHPIFGGAPQSVWANVPTAVVENTGSGGGGGAGASAGVYSGGGGGSGGACDIIIENPASSYTFAIGTGGPGGVGGAGYSGGKGSNGVIEVSYYSTSFESALFSGLLAKVLPQTAGAVTTGGTEKIIHGVFVMGTGAACAGASTTCTPLTNGKSSMITSVVRSNTTAGRYTVNVPGGMCVGPVSCAGNGVAPGVNQTILSFTSASTTTYDFYTLNVGNLTQSIDSAFNLTCSCIGSL